MTKRKPRSEHKVNPRTLTDPIGEQDPKIRRARAKNRALMILKYKRRAEYRALYQIELEKVGLVIGDDFV